MTALPTDLIDIRADARAVDETAVAGLAESIADVGLINPIRVRPNGDRWEVIAGVHRLHAHRQLGLAEIEAIVVTDDDLHAELAMIDENLCRAELSPAERARHIARRKAIYLELHPETGRGGDRKSIKVTDGEFDRADSFVTHTAAVTGLSKQTIYREAARGEKVIPEVLDLVTGTELDTAKFLDEIKGYSPSDQFIITQRKLANIASHEREQKRKAKAAKLDADVKARAAREAAEIIAEHVPGEWWDNLKANLYAAGAKHVADALTNITGESVMDRSAAA